MSLLYPASVTTRFKHDHIANGSGTEQHESTRERNAPADVDLPAQPVHDWCNRLKDSQGGG